MTLSSLQSKILEEFDEKFTRSDTFVREVLSSDIKSFISSALQRQLDEIRGMVEGMKIPCIGNPEVMQSLEERIANKTLSDILTLLK